MYKKVSLLVGLLGMTVSSINAFAAEENNPQRYKLAVALPAAWKVASNEHYDGGYVKVFVPQSAGGRLNEQNVVINYTQKIESSLSAAMQDIEKVVATADCSTREVKVIDQNKTSINFVALLDKCKNGKSLTQVFKVFNTPHGQYAILYTANPNKVTADMINHMEKLVKTADIVPA